MKKINYLGKLNNSYLSTSSALAGIEEQTISKKTKTFYQLKMWTY